MPNMPNMHQISSMQHMSQHKPQGIQSASTIKKNIMPKAKQDVFVGWGFYDLRDNNQNLPPKKSSWEKRNRFGEALEVGSTSKEIFVCSPDMLNNNPKDKKGSAPNIRVPAHGNGIKPFIPSGMKNSGMMNSGPGSEMSVTKGSNSLGKGHLQQNGALTDSKSTAKSQFREEVERNVNKPKPYADKLKSDRNGKPYDKTIFDKSKKGEKVEKDEIKNKTDGSKKHLSDDSTGKSTGEDKKEKNNPSNEEVNGGGGGSAGGGSKKHLSDDSTGKSTGEDKKEKNNPSNEEVNGGGGGSAGGGSTNTVSENVSGAGTGGGIQSGGGGAGDASTNTGSGNVSGTGTGGGIQSGGNTGGESPGSGTGGGSPYGSGGGDYGGAGGGSGGGAGGGSPYGSGGGPVGPGGGDYGGTGGGSGGGDYGGGDYGGGDEGGDEGESKREEEEEESGGTDLLDRVEKMMSRFELLIEKLLGYFTEKTESTPENETNESTP
jgi:hypothetical protein